MTEIKATYCLFKKIPISCCHVNCTCDSVGKKLVSKKIVRQLVNWLCMIVVD